MPTDSGLRNSSKQDVACTVHPVGEGVSSFAFFLKKTPTERQPNGSFGKIYGEALLLLFFFSV
jgi:hypothetical protein